MDASINLSLCAGGEPSGIALSLGRSRRFVPRWIPLHPDEVNNGVRSLLLKPEPVLSANYTRFLPLDSTLVTIISPRMPPPIRHPADSDSDSDSDSDPPPAHDEEPTLNLGALLERSRWTKHWYCTVPSDPRYSSEKWIYISHDGSMFEGAWHRHTYSASKCGGTEVICKLRSRLSPSRDETLIHWLGAVFTTDIRERGDLRERRKLVFDWLKRNVCLFKMPRPFPYLKEWSLSFVEEGCAFSIHAMTEDRELSGSGRIYKPLIQAQSNPKGMEVRLFYDKPSADLPKLMDREMGLVNLVILYFALMSFDTMPPPPLPLKAQRQLREQHEMDFGDSSEDDAGPSSGSDSDISVDDY